MPRVTLARSAVDKLMKDPTLDEWHAGVVGQRVPILGYYQRSYSTSLRDGTVTEHGDGFALGTIDPQDALETRGLVIRSAAVTGQLTILVGGDASVMADSFAIGWSGAKYTFGSNAPL